MTMFGVLDGEGQGVRQLKRMARYAPRTHSLGLSMVILKIGLIEILGPVHATWMKVVQIEQEEGQLGLLRLLDKDQSFSALLFAHLNRIASFVKNVGYLVCRGSLWRIAPQSQMLRDFEEQIKYHLIILLSLSSTFRAIIVAGDTNDYFDIHDTRWTVISLISVSQLHYGSDG
jgi:hypothetical protein